MKTHQIQTDAGLTLALHEFAHAPDAPQVLYLHGATFPAKLSIGFRFDGFSWADDLTQAGYGVWGLDFAGYGDSDRYARGEFGDSGDVLPQIAAAVSAIAADMKLSIIAHSWGTIAAGRFAAANPELVNKLVLFGPIALRHGSENRNVTNPTRQVTIQDQYDRFIADVPQGEPPVLSDAHFAAWAESYLDSDPDARAVNAVTIPSGPAREIGAAWRGQFPYDLSQIVTPTLIVRGEWDSLIPDHEAAWFMAGLCNAPKLDIVIPKATHLMHLEANRFALYEATRNFLR